MSLNRSGGAFQSVIGAIPTFASMFPLRQPKLRLSNVPVKITGVYRHIFQVEEASPGQTKRHALQYTDVLTHSIELLDL